MVLFNCEIVGEIMEILVNFNDIVCGGADVLRILRFVFILLDMVCWIVPMGLIVMLMVDFGKNVIAGKEDEMKKNLNMVIKRIIYCIILFLVPTIVNFVVGIVSNVGVEAARCMEIARDHDDDLSRYEIDYETFEPEKKENNCYYCIENDSGKKYFSYIWSTTKIENNNFENKICTPVGGISTENECNDKNNTIEYCYYCDSTKKYHYGIEPEEVCSSSWKKDYYKDKEHCKIDDVEEDKEYCYVCSVGDNTMYKWSNTKPNDICMAANGWQIDYSIKYRASCIYKP